MNISAMVLVKIYLLQSPAESFKDTLHVSTLLHGDDPGVVLLVNPYQEGLVKVVPVKTIALLYTGFGNESLHDETQLPLFIYFFVKRLQN